MRQLKWPNRDPIQERGGINLYAFSRNAPISFFEAYGLDPGDMYSDCDSAARDAMRDILPPSLETKWEYGGLVYKDPSGFYSYTPPVTEKSPDRVKCFKAKPEVPKGCWIVGLYHSHGGDVYKEAEGFSKEDRYSSVRNPTRRTIRCYLVSIRVSNPV
jgi:hypothetical protein